MTHHQALQDIIEDQVIKDKSIQNVLRTIASKFV